MNPDTQHTTFIASLLKKHIPLISIGIIFTLLYTIMVFLVPLVSEYLIDDVLTSTSMEIVYGGIFLFVAVCALQPIFGFLKDLAFIHVTERMVYELRAWLFSKMVRLKYQLIEGGNSGDFLSRMTNDIRGISSFFTEVLAIILKDILLVILVIIGMFMQSMVITSVITIAFVLFYIVNLLISKKFEKLSKLSLENYDTLCSSINSSWKNIVLIKTYSLILKSIETFGSVINRTKKINIQLGKWNALLSGLSGLIMVLSLAAIYSMGVLFIIEGSMTLGSVIALGLYFQLLSGPIQELNYSVVQYKETKPSIERISNYLSLSEEFPESELREFDKDDYEIVSQIDVKEISFSYKDENDCSKPILSNASVSIRGNGLYSIIGTSGSGKSTLLKLLVSLYEPTSGSIQIDNSTKDTIHTRKVYSYVPQDFEMLCETIRYNLLLEAEPSPTNEESIRQLAEELLMNDVIETLPNSYDTVLTENASFSGGERRRLALMRAILSNRPVLLLDEITSGLDAESADRVVLSLERHAKNRIVIVATHDKRVMKKSDIVFKILDGKIVRLNE